MDVVGNKSKEREADVYRDELQSLITQLKANPSEKIVIDLENGTVNYKDTATLLDYGIMNIQMNHDWKIGIIIYPHLHWLQENAGIPNWLYEYRWLLNGQIQDPTWLFHPCEELAFNYTSGTLVQISKNCGIIPPAGAGLSSILQVRIIRDTQNDSGAFSGVDTYTGQAKAVNFDIHMLVDARGSIEQYRKF